MKKIIKSVDGVYSKHFIMKLEQQEELFNIFEDWLIKGKYGIPNNEIRISDTARA